MHIPAPDGAIIVFIGSPCGVTNMKKFEQFVFLAERLGKIALPLAHLALAVAVLIVIYFTYMKI